MCMCLCVCVSAPEASNNQWCDVAWYGPHMIGQTSTTAFVLAAIVGIISRHGLRIEAHRRSQPNKSKLALYKPLLRLYCHLNSRT